MTKKINLTREPKPRYFTVDDDGTIYSCNTGAKNITEALEIAEQVGKNQVIEITFNDLDFIASQFGYRIEKLTDK